MSVNITGSRSKGYLLEYLSGVGSAGKKYIALSTGTISDDAGTGCVEPSTTNNYARVAIGSNSGNEMQYNSSISAYENATEIKFNHSVGDWGTIVAVAIWDSATGGNFLGAVNLDSSDYITVRGNSIVYIPAGQLTIKVV